jgi:hypothetical protein
VTNEALGGSPPISLQEALARSLGEVRAEYETDDDLFDRFSEPVYFDRLLGMTPSFLVGGRGTGKTTTLRSMSFRGQARISNSPDPASWRVLGAYWKAEPNIVSAFRGKGLSPDDWTPIFSHYLNLRLCALVLQFESATRAQTQVAGTLKSDAAAMFCRALHLPDARSLEDLVRNVDFELAGIEANLNGSIKGLRDMPGSVPGRPLDYLFDAVAHLGASQHRPFTFCVDEYENFEQYQQVILNTLIKAVGSAPYTFTIGVRDASAIERETLVIGQPLQDPADFTTVDIVQHLKDERFVDFAREVLHHRLSSTGWSHLPLPELLPSVTNEEEIRLLGGEGLEDEIVQSFAGLSDEETSEARALPLVQLAMVRYWSAAHDESPSSVLRFARRFPQRWRTRVGNHAYEMLFTLRQNAVGIRKYYSGWKTFCQVSDGNIRYLLRISYEALRSHVNDGGTLEAPVSYRHQTEAARRAGATTLRELQGWSREGGALTRLTLGLGRIFGGLARELTSTTPEVNQFRLKYQAHGVPAEEVEQVLSEAVGQGVIIAFDGDKNARLSGATRELDYQLHPIFAAYFTYSPRRKRRLTISAEDLMAMTTRQSSATIRRILEARGAGELVVPEQLRIFEDGLDAGP